MKDKVESATTNSTSVQKVYYSLEQEVSHKYLDQIWSSDPVKCLESVEFLKNVAIGSNRQKQGIIELGLVPRFLQILDQFQDQVSQQEDLLFETTACINSLAKGLPEHAKCLIDAGTVRVLFNVILNPNQSSVLTTIALKTLRSLFQSPHAPHSLIYEWDSVVEGDKTVTPEQLISHLLHLASNTSNSPNNFSNQEAVCVILSKSIESEEGGMGSPVNQHRQKLLSNCNAVAVISSLLISPSYMVQISALKFLAQISHENDEVSRMIVTTCPRNASLHHHHHHHHRGTNSGSGPILAPFSGNIGGIAGIGQPNSIHLQTVPDILANMMSQESTLEMQLLAAKCMTYLYRSGVICSEDKRIVYKTLPTLIRCCKPSPPPIGYHARGSSTSSKYSLEKELSLRAEAADILSILTETDISLQQTASYCDQVIPTIASLLKGQQQSSIGVTSSTASSSHVISVSFTTGNFMFADGDLGQLGSHSSSSDKKMDASTSMNRDKVHQEMRASAFKAFASIAANDEDIRKKILETESIMDYIINGLSDSNVKIRYSALKCLHSLSRSVQSLRQLFQEHSLWTPLKNILNDCPNTDMLLLASSTLCNLLLEFSPSTNSSSSCSKPGQSSSSSSTTFLDRQTLEILVSLTTRSETNLRVNGVWALMNMVYKADQAVKMLILNSLGMERIFQLINDDDEAVVMKTLGLLRNLLSTKSHIDQIMTGSHGKEIMDALILILDSNDSSQDVKEQAYCVLANIADGDASKEIIMNNEEILTRINSILEEDQSQVRLQMAATFVITNLVWAEDEGSLDRQNKLKQLGIYSNLTNLLETSDTDLFDKVKTAVHQFP